MAELDSDSDCSDFSEVLSFNSDYDKVDDGLESGYHNRGVQPYAFQPTLLIRTHLMKYFLKFFFFFS